MKLHNKETGEDGLLIMCRDYDEYPLFVAIGSIKIYYHTFADMIKAGWDCIKIPAEPLIKDEKVRKAVRAWAEANGVKEVEPRGIGDTLLYFKGDDRGGLSIEIEFYVNVDDYTHLAHKDIYTITELCGEEE